MEDKLQKEIQEMIDTLTEYKESKQIVEVGMERDAIPNIDGPGFRYGDKLYIKFTIRD